MKSISEELNRSLGNSGFKSALVSIRNVSDLRSDYESFRQQRIFDPDFYNEWLAHYTFGPPADFPDAQSIIVTAARQPNVVVKFKADGKTYPVIIPPTYSYDTDKKALNVISRIVREYGCGVSDAVLPVKSLAVRCGLASYGRNNIAYIDDWGSFFRLKAFYSDVPYAANTWRDYEMMDRCKTCVACLKKCPTDAISDDRFVLHAERCLTFLNERAHPFPEWVDPTWHNCLVGCMVCQNVCPVNRDVVDWSVEDGEFSEEETSLILEGAPEDTLPAQTIEKMDGLDILEYYDLLGRNLSVLIDRNSRRCTQRSP